MQRRPDTGQPLTVREREVALLVTEGATNREVAAALSLSPKTVSAHLQRIYAKLGIHRRSRLAYLVGTARDLEIVAPRPPAESRPALGE